MKNLMTVLAMITSMALVSVGGGIAQPTIDGVINPLDEWDAYYLGTSVTAWGGGMSVDVYGFADDTHLYVAYVADKNQPGWSVADGLNVGSNFYYSTVKDSNLLDTVFHMENPGVTWQVMQTSDWVTWEEKGTLDDVGVVYGYTSMWDDANSDKWGVAELKIPLSLIAIEGAIQVELYGQYWQYDWPTTLFYVSLDLEGPLASNILAVPNPVAVGTAVDLSATVDDSTTGGSNIKSAEYSLDGGAWQSMADTFNSPTENVTATFTALSAPGVYDLCVRGTDIWDNTGTPECILLVVYDPEGGFVTGGGWIESPAGAIGVEDVAFFNGFENNTEGWVDFGGSVSRVASGTNGITSADGDWHAEIVVGVSNLDTAFTRWGGYNSQFPPGGYSTSIDIYLDVDGGFVNDTRFDWTSAINNPDGDHRRDFAFNGGFYDDDDGSPGSGLNRFVFTASNNCFRPDSWPKNPARDPIAITSSGWYTFQHRFYDSGGRVLAVDLSIIDSFGNVVQTWTLSDPTDIIGDTVGGNRYGWFASIEFPFLAIDNSLRTGFAYPTGRANFGFVSKYQKGAKTPTGKTEFVFQAADLNFHSDTYDWLVVTQGGSNAQFKGEGTINGAYKNGNPYKFMLWAGDDDPDTFRIRIWWEDESDGVENVVYDNAFAQAIGGGSIVIHTSKK